MQESAAPPAPPTPRPPWVVWTGLAVVLAAAAVLSFDSLRQLALSVSISPHLAWLLPVAVDAGASVSCATWLGGRTTRTASRFAGRMTWALLAVTVLGNAAQLGMHAHGITPPWWVAVLVGSIPPAVVGSVVHLVVLLVRATETGHGLGETREVAESTRTAGPIEAEEPDQVTGPDQTDEDPMLVRVRELADRTGKRPSRNAIVRELGVGATRAARLLEAFDRTGPRRAA